MKIIDWQFFSSCSPTLDLANMVFYNCHPDIMRPNLQNVYEKYSTKFAESCKNFGLEPPVSLQEIIRTNEKMAAPLSLIFILFFYDPVGLGMPERISWLWKLILEKNPDFFD